MSNRKPTDLLKAQSRGRFFTNGLFPFAELSRHEGIINLIDTETGLVRSLIAMEENMTAFSLLVPDFFRIRRGVSPSGSVPLPRSGSYLEIDGKAISLEDCPLWNGTPPHYPAREERIKRELSLLTAQLDPGESFLTLLGKEDRTVFQKKAREITGGQRELGKVLPEGLEQLIGLGPGLTPAGDDFLTGVLLAQNHFPACPPMDTQKIEERLKQTTAPGRTMLYGAIRGSFPAFILKYLEERESVVSEEEILTSLKRAARHGSTSGRDCLAGYYWSLSRFLSDWPQKASTFPVENEAGLGTDA